MVSGHPARRLQAALTRSAKSTHGVCLLLSVHVSINLKPIHYFIWLHLRPNMIGEILALVCWQTPVTLVYMKLYTKLVKKFLNVVELHSISSLPLAATRGTNNTVWGKAASLLSDPHESLDPHTPAG